MSHNFHFNFSQSFRTFSHKVMLIHIYEQKDRKGPKIGSPKWRTVGPSVRTARHAIVNGRGRKKRRIDTRLLSIKKIIHDMDGCGHGYTFKLLKGGGGVTFRIVVTELIYSTRFMSYEGHYSRRIEGKRVLSVQEMQGTAAAELLQSQIRKFVLIVISCQI